MSYKRNVHTVTLDRPNPTTIDFDKVDRSTDLAVGPRQTPGVLAKARELARKLAVEQGDHFAVITVDGTVRCHRYTLFPPTGYHYLAVPTEDQVMEAIGRREVPVFFARNPGGEYDAGQLKYGPGDKDHQNALKIAQAFANQRGRRCYLYIRARETNFWGTGPGDIPYLWISEDMPKQGEGHRKLSHVTLITPETLRKEA